MTPEDHRVAETTLHAAASDLLAYFERRTSSPHEAADLLGESFLQAWRRIDKLPVEPERQRMWLFTIAAHVLANSRRGSRRRAALTDRLRRTVADATPDHSEAADVRDAVLRLHAAQRELVMLIHWDGFSIIEAAELLGLNASTARSRYAAARQVLKSALAEQANNV